MMTSLLRRGEYERVRFKIAQVGSIVLVLFMVVAIIIQDYTVLLPAGIVNQHHDQYRLLSNGCFFFLIAILLILSAELWRSDCWRIGSAVRTILVVLAMTEILLFVLDRTVVSRNPESFIGGPYYERPTARAGWVILKKPNSVSPLGFRTDHHYRPIAARPRILFLGDSYTEGSGRSTECNYPNVVERTLRKYGLDYEIMNAGVAGYGPHDALNLLQFLVNHGYRFDALVYNLFAENDFTDNLPGTFRHVVGGIIFRSPLSWFPRKFHPLNSYLFRYALIVRQLRNAVWKEPKAASLHSGPCDFSEGGQPEFSREFRELIDERLATNKRATESESVRQEFGGSLRAMKAAAEGLKIPFWIVVFPDRIDVDNGLSNRLGVDEGQIASPRLMHQLFDQVVPGTPTIEVREALKGRAAMYRADDTHLSDLGNLTSGEYVADKLFYLLQQLQWLKASSRGTRPSN